MDAREIENDVLDCRRPDLSWWGKWRLSNKIHDHIKKNWPEGLGYNAWYSVHRAQSTGWLNDKFEPQEGEPIPTAMEELMSLGGIEAVRAYHQIMKESEVE